MYLFRILNTLFIARNIYILSFSDATSFEISLKKLTHYQLNCLCYLLLLNFNFIALVVTKHDLVAHGYIVLVQLLWLILMLKW